MTYASSFPFAGKQCSFKLPKEHGAVVVFSLSCIISLLLCRAEPTVAACSEIVLWAMVLSMHQPRQLLVVTALGILVLQLFFGAPLALLIAIVWVGLQATKSSHARNGFWWREAVGMSGVALAPLMVSYLVAGDHSLPLTAAAALLAAVFTGSALIRVSRKETRVNPIPAALLSLVLWLCLTAASPIIAALSLIPYVAQSIWLVQESSPSFKTLGQIQSLSLLWVAAAITIHIFGIA